MAFSEKTKSLAKRRAHFRCVVCHEPFVEVHHIVPQRDHGRDDLENAAPLCGSCHDRFGGNPEKRKQLREMRDHWWEHCASLKPDSSFVAVYERLDTLREDLFSVRDNQIEARTILAELRSTLTRAHESHSTISPGLACLLRDRREHLELDLTEVVTRATELGFSLSVSAVQSIEDATAEPPLAQLLALFRIYGLPLQAADDVLEIERFAGELPPSRSMTASQLFEQGVASLREGNARKAMAAILMAQRTAPNDSDSARRQEAILAFAHIAASLDRLVIAKQLLEDLLIEKLDPQLVISALVQSAIVWERMGSTEAAFAFLRQAESRLTAGAYRERGWIEHIRARITSTLGDRRTSDEFFRVAIRAYHQAGDAHGESLALGTHARMLEAASELTEALSKIRRARRIAETNGLDKLATHQCNREGHILIKLGRIAEGLTTLRKALANGAMLNDRALQFYSHYFLWLAYEAAGDAVRAKAEQNFARQLVRFVDEPSQEATEIRNLPAPDGNS